MVPPSNALPDSPPLHPAPAGMQWIAWHHLRTLVPADWEVTAYSVEDRLGRIELGSRKGLLALFSWEPCEREPDRRTTMLSFLRRHVLGVAKQREMPGTEAFRTASIGPFLLGWMGPGGPCQALAYAPQQQKLLRWIFEPAVRWEADWPETLRPILATFDCNDGEIMEYRLHGIHARLPRAYELEDMVSLPANVMISFEHSKTHRRAVFRRWGLPEMILAGKGLAEFHAAILRTSGSLVQQASTACVNDCEACVSEFNAPREHHMDRFMGRRWGGGEAVLWHDRESRRLHAFEQVGPEASDPLVFSDCLPGWTLQANP